MLDLFAIFSRSGIVLWCFQSTSQLVSPHLNAFIKAVILQKMLQLMYVDKFLDDIHLQFRDMYKEELLAGDIYQRFDIRREFERTLKDAEDWEREQAAAPKAMRTFEDSAKSKKTVSSMIERKGDQNDNQKKKVSKKQETQVDAEPVLTVDFAESEKDENEFAMFEKKKVEMKKGVPQPKSPKNVTSPGRKGKTQRTWDLGGTSKDLPNLEYSKDSPGDVQVTKSEFLPDYKAIGSLKGNVPDMEVNGNYDDEADSKGKKKSQAKKSDGVFSLFKGLVGGKTVTRDGLAPVLEKLRDHLISKNVASEIAGKLCDSVANNLEGKVLGTFESLSTTVKGALRESLTKILSPQRRVNILPDINESRRNNKPYVISFCGVNGVGKSTNLAKICFWLLENEFSVLIAACDTFRAGAVEQLRTHMRHLNAMHPSNKTYRSKYGREIVELYEKGYGKDAAGIAAEAINYARDTKRDVVLVDTAGRMQDNEPLMRALAKLITVNEPDLVLFVGEALVGNEAVDQLVKFNQALADFSPAVNPHLIDGIVLTKFDTIDDKVGAAISMTYITGQPIVFVGTGQTYVDLKTLNVQAVVEALMR